MRGGALGLPGPGPGPRSASASQPGRELPVWVAVGGTPASVVRAAKFNLPLALAIIGGNYRQFAPFVDLYRQAAAQSGHNPSKLKVSINSPGFLAATHREAIEISHPYFESGWMANHHQRGRGVPMPLAAYEAQSTPAGAFFLGSPQEVIDKIIAQYELFHHDRTTIQMGFGNVPQKECGSFFLYGSAQDAGNVSGTRGPAQAWEGTSLRSNYHSTTRSNTRPVAGPCGAGSQL
jgi:alkanesulfonate monooxygenase SsuD/methylene tetrahydromethanopterin reductase-like flavin-dependent oxidoreductase (luciferase family)